MPATWKFADGTVLRLGGEVEGSSELAESLRRDVHATRGGSPPPVGVFVQPGGDVDLDLGNVAIVHHWAAEASIRFRVEMVGQPDRIPELEDPDGWTPDDFDPDVIY